MRRLRALNARIEASWIGDLIGVLCLFFLLFSALVMIGVFQ